MLPWSFFHPETVLHEHPSLHLWVFTLNSFFFSFSKIVPFFDTTYHLIFYVSVDIQHEPYPRFVSSEPRRSFDWKKKLRFYFRNQLSFDVFYLSILNYVNWILNIYWEHFCQLTPCTEICNTEMATENSSSLSIFTDFCACTS